MSVKYVAIVDAQGNELVRNPVTESIPLDLLMSAAKLTCESWNRDHPGDGWKTVIVKTDE